MQAASVLFTVTLGKSKVGEGVNVDVGVRVGEEVEEGVWVIVGMALGVKVKDGVKVRMGV